MVWLLSIVIVASLDPKEPTSDWLAWLERAESLRLAHRGAEAETAYAQALRAARLAGPDDPATAIVLHNTGFFHHGEGRVREAIQLYSASHRWYAARQPEYLAYLVRVLTNLGVAYAELGQWSKAEALIRPWLGITPAYEGDLARLRGLFASILARQRKYTEAEPLLAAVRAALEREPRSALQQESLAQTISNQAALYQATDRSTASLASYETALAILTALDSRVPITLVRTLYEASLAWIAAGRQDRAIEFYAQAVTVAESAKIAEHPAVATVMSGYAGLLRKLHRKTEAKGFERHAQQIWQRYERENLLGYTVDAQSFR